jgi:quinol monooxygenase YgiN
VRGLSSSRQQRRSEPVRFYENWRTRKELDEHLQTPILTSFWARRLDLLEQDVEIKFITMLSDLD